jgi:hypothetical protein
MRLLFDSIHSQVIYSDRTINNSLLDYSNTMLRSPLYHRSSSKLSHQFSLLIVHDVHLFESVTLVSDRTRPILVLIYFGRIHRKI